MLSDSFTIQSLNNAAKICLSQHYKGSIDSVTVSPADDGGAEGVFFDRDRVFVFHIRDRKVVYSPVEGVE